MHISSPDDAARWARRRDQEELARKVRVRVFWWIAAAIVFTAFILAATVLLAQDNPEAVRWYRLAADQAGAQSLLGSMYALGWGVRRDLGLAYMWLNIASANGEEAARERLDNLEDDMTRAEISRATELARTCMTSDYKDCEP